MGHSLSDKAGLRVHPHLLTYFSQSLDERGAKMPLLAPFYGQGS